MEKNEKWRILTSGPDWEGWKYYPEIERIIQEVKSSLHISVYALTYNPLIPLIIDAIKKGINTEIYICNDLEVNRNIINSKFIQLARIHSSFRFYSLKSENILHTKIFIGDLKEIILGSANLTVSGLFSNYELGISFSNSKAAFEIVEKLRQLRKYSL